MQKTQRRMKSEKLMKKKIRRYRKGCGEGAEMETFLVKDEVRRKKNERV